jgi:flagellar basal body-associated protein FliL
MAEEKPKGDEKGKDEGGDKAASAKGANKPFNKKILIIAGVIVADLAIMGGLGLFIVGKLKKPAEVDPAIEALKKQEEEEAEKKHNLTKIGMVLPKPLPFTVNIPGAQGQSHYLKCSIQFEWDGVESAEGGGEHGAGPALDATGNEIVKRMPKITDIIINILSSQSYDELLKPSGKQKMKEAIVTEINAILPEPHLDPKEEEKRKKDPHAEPPPSGKLRNAFFTEFIVQ